MLYRTDINSGRILRWGLLYSSLLPLMVLVFALMATLGGRWAFVWKDFFAGFPWAPFLLVSVGLGLTLTALAAGESRRNNQLWLGFFGKRRFDDLLRNGFWMDRYGVHGYWHGLPVSVYYEKETLGDYAKITAYTAISDDVDVLRELGREYGAGWFFLPDELERLVDPPFDHIDWTNLLNEVWALAERRGFEAATRHPWARSGDQTI